MRVGRMTLFRLGLVWSVSVLTLPAGAAQDGDIPAPDLPQPVLSFENADLSAPESRAQGSPVVLPPDLPEITVLVPPEPPQPASGIPDLVLPEPPQTAVTITAADRFQSALPAQLAAFLSNDGVALPRKEREAVVAFYEARDHRPLWTDGSAWTASAKAVMDQLAVADEDGLDPADYPLPAFASEASLDPEDAAAAEVRLTASVVAYARDARGARIQPSRLSKLITPTLALPSVDDVLATVSAAPDAAAALAGYNPRHPGYKALKAKLADLRANSVKRPMVKAPHGRALRVGMRDPRVPLIRARFNLGSADGDDNTYDERVASAVADFQKEKGLPANGVLTRQTIAALGGGASSARLEGDLIANMERWRWLPVELGERHIAVNVPEYRLRIVDGGEVSHATRVIVGTAKTPTPIFSDEMETVIVNPSWTIPPSIMKNEILPGMAADPTYAERRGYKVIRRGDRIVVQQPPGERNALGYVKFIFPNDHAVYLHDTPTRKLFTAERRAFSHGCVRVDQPFALAEEILKEQGSWTEKRLRGLIGKGERYIALKKRLPVHLTYFTVSVDEKGRLQTFADLYGFHKKVRAALGFDA